MVNYELSVAELTGKKILGVKLPKNIDELNFKVAYDGKTVELPISGIPNSSVILEVLGHADQLEFVYEQAPAKPEAHLEEAHHVESGDHNAEHVAQPPVQPVAEHGTEHSEVHVTTETSEGRAQ